MVEDSDSPEEEGDGEKKENDPVHPPPLPPGCGQDEEPPRHVAGLNRVYRLLGVLRQVLQALPLLHMELGVLDIGRVPAARRNTFVDFRRGVRALARLGRRTHVCDSPALAFSCSTGLGNSLSG